MECKGIIRKNNAGHRVEPQSNIPHTETIANSKQNHPRAPKPLQIAVKIDPGPPKPLQIAIKINPGL